MTFSKTKGVIAVDIDLTVAASDLAYWDWLQLVTSQDKVFPYNTEELEYNLGEYFFLPTSCDAMAYWRYDDIYDENTSRTRFDINPVGGSQEVLENLHNLGYEIVFVSQVEGDHHKSKVEWVKRHFPFMSGFLATKEKQYVMSKIFIDDRNKHLVDNLSPYRIKFNTPYIQDVELDDNELFLISDDWYEIEKKIMEITNV